MIDRFRRIILPLCAAFAATLSTASAQAVLDGIAAKVNEDVITFRQVRDLVGAKEKALQQQYSGQELTEKTKQVRLAALNELIDRQLILQKFKEMQKTGAAIPDHVVEEHIETIVREEFAGNRSAFIRTLAAEGYTLDKFKKDETDKIIVQAMRSQLVKASSIVAEPKIGEYYHSHIQQFSSDGAVKLRMIVIKKGDASANRRRMIEEIRQKIASGASFEDLARMYSEDSTTQETGGDWGWITPHTLNPELSGIAFSLKPGEMSHIVEMAGNYYLLYCEAKKSGTVKPFAAVRGDIEKALAQEERQKAQQVWLDKLRKKAYIKIM